MNKFFGATGALALMVITPAMAGQQKGGDQGKGRQGASIKADRGGNAKADRGSKQAKPDRQSVPQGRPADSAEKGPKADPARGAGPKAERADKAHDRGNGRAARMAEGDGQMVVRRDFTSPRSGRANAAFGCPPGLERKHNGCLPPGQAKKLLGAPLPTGFRDTMIPYAYRNWYRDSDDFLFRTGDGFIYRVNRGDNLVDGLIPLFGSGYYTMGDPWPQPYNFYNVPYQYRSYWPDSSDYHYRYGDGAIYRVDAQSQLVNGIVALLAGDLGVGAPLPAGYDVYNVPFAYRDRYADSATNWYRYNDGYIYRVDPTTRLITEVIDAIL